MVSGAEFGEEKKGRLLGWSYGQPVDAGGVEVV